MAGTGRRCWNLDYGSVCLGWACDVEIFYQCHNGAKYERNIIVFFI